MVEGDKDALSVDDGLKLDDKDSESEGERDLDKEDERLALIDSDSEGLNDGDLLGLKDRLRDSERLTDKDSD